MKNIRRAVCLVALLALGGGLVSGLLSSCQDQYPAIFQPVDVSLSGQTARMDFDITKTQEFDYIFALAFVINTDEPEPGDNTAWIRRHKKRQELLGGYYITATGEVASGVIIPVRLHVIRDGTVLFDGVIRSEATRSMRYGEYQGRGFNVKVRKIKTFFLSPGHYSATLTTLQSTPEFAETEVFFHMSSYGHKP